LTTHTIFFSSVRALRRSVGNQALLET